MTLTLAIGPVHLDTEGQDLRRRLAMRLVDALSTPVEVVQTETYADVAAKLQGGEADLGWLPPAQYVRAEEDGPLTLLARVERSSGDGYRGVLFVRQDADVNTVADLSDKAVAWVDKDSCAGHLFVRLALREGGHETQFSEERFAGSHHAVVQAVISGEADAGATHAQTLDDGETLLLTGWHPFVGADGMRPLLVSSPIPSDVICAAGALDAAVAHDVKAALLALHEEDAGDLVEEFFGGARLVGADPSDYDTVRAALDTPAQTGR
ncbi:MAG: phosphate/phosphite/phosphonate ABC transporter substrate-binding protein [Sandaracinaceae bacterium]